MARQNRIHVIAHARPASRDIQQLGFVDVDEYLAFIHAHTPSEYRVTCRKKLLAAREDESRGGRSDDLARADDIQAALADPRTLALIALNGGCWFTRILPHIQLDVLAKRRTPVWVLGFSEMTSLVNLVATYAAGRGVYWLCPNYLAWKIRPAAAARAAFADFWRNLPAFIDERQAADTGLWVPIEGRILSGHPKPGRLRLVGGCLSVLTASLAGPVARRVRPDGRWLFVEDIDEPPYRIDRYFATLKLAGWFEKLAGVVLGDLHGNHGGQEASHVSAAAALLKHHMPPKRPLPILHAPRIGHTWPMVPVPVNRPVRLELGSGKRFVMRTCPGG